MNNQFLKFFKLGFLSSFKFNVFNIQKKKEINLIEYFTTVEEDLNVAFNKLKSKYERN